MDMVFISLRNPTRYSKRKKIVKVDPVRNLARARSASPEALGWAISYGVDHPPVFSYTDKN